jgi:hypothetical protein
MPSNTFSTGMPASMAALNVDNPYWQRQAMQRVLDAQADIADQESLDRVFANDPTRQRLNAEAKVAGKTVVDDYLRKKKASDALADAQSEADAYFLPDRYAMGKNQLEEKFGLAEATKQAPAEITAQGRALQALIEQVGRLQAALATNQGRNQSAAIRNIPDTVDPTTGQPTAAAPSNERFLPPGQAAGQADPEIPPMVVGPKGSAPGWLVKAYAERNQIPLAEALRQFKLSFGAQ